jgi:heme-degrading monooxygenase HmoA
MELAKIPEPPYYTVIFSSIKNGESNTYDNMSKKMVELVDNQPGFLGFESAQEEIGITISYWESIDYIQQWKMNVNHLDAQIKGKTDWYKSYVVRIAKVEREYSFDNTEF